jgi:hypothetical protein
VDNLDKIKYIKAYRTLLPELNKIYSEYNFSSNPNIRYEKELRFNRLIDEIKTCIEPMGFGLVMIMGADFGGRGYYPPSSNRMTEYKIIKTYDDK